MGGGRYDVFLSYASPDRVATESLFGALCDLGLRVFRDDREIRPGAVDLTDNVRDALAASRLLVGWASTAWRASAACRWELTAAACVATAEGAPVMRRVALVVPPGPDESAVRAALPPFLRTSRVEAAGDAHGVARAIAARVAEAGEPMVAATQRTRPRWVGPPRAHSTRFVGREAELWATHSALMDAGAAALIGASATATGAAQVHGLGGNGKTLLAAEYALRFGWAWPGGVVWVEAAGHTPEVALRTVLAERGDAEEPPVTLSDEARAAWFRGRLGRALGDEPLLWVVDDPPSRAASGASVAPLSAWRCPLANARTLLTTRVGGQAGYSPVYVGVLEVEHALTLLRRGAAWTPDALEGGRAVVRRLGQHPLAVDVAGALLARHAWAPTDLLAKLDEQGRLDALERTLAAEGEADALREQLPTGHEPSVLRTLGLSWEALRPSARLVLRACASLAEADVPVALVEAGLRTEVAEDEVAASIAQAVDSGLASRLEGRLREGDPACPALRVHGLVREVAVRLWGDAEAVEAALEARMREAIGEVAETPWRHGEVRPMLEHAEVLGRRWQRGAGGVPLVLGTAWKAAGELGRARANDEAAMAARELVHGREDVRTLAAISNLAGTLYAQGDLTGARRLNERALEARTRLQGPEHPDTLTTLQDVAVTLQAQGDLTGAQRLFERALDAMTRVLGREHPDTLGTLQNLALTLLAQGDLTGARGRLERVLNARTRLQGPEHPHTLTALQNLAGTLYAQGDLGGARGLFERALEAMTHVLGPEHPDVTASRYNLIHTLRGIDPRAAAEHIAILGRLRARPPDSLSGHERAILARLPHLENFSPGPSPRAIAVAVAIATVAAVVAYFFLR